MSAPNRIHPEQVHIYTLGFLVVEIKPFSFPVTFMILAYTCFVAEVMIFCPVLVWAFLKPTDIDAGWVGLSLGLGTRTLNCQLTYEDYRSLKLRWRKEKKSNKTGCDGMDCVECAFLSKYLSYLLPI